MLLIGSEVQVKVNEVREENICTKQETILNRQLPYAHWLYSVPGIGSKTIRLLLEHFETPEKIYQISAEALEEILELPRKKSIVEKIMASKQTWDIYREYNKLKAKHIKFTCLGHECYPKRLSKIADAPFGIYYIGRLPEERKPVIAVIGARSCSEYGRKMAFKFGEELGYAGVQVISGMARGIDSISQWAAVRTGGYSLGVLGCGVDICYPEENRELYTALCNNGGVCSEYLPGTLPQSRLFPPRNRIISGISDAVLVIEAKKRSGTLITVDMALEQGRDVYALPGKVTDALSDGCNQLIKQGAAIALSPQELLEDIWEMQRNRENVLNKIQQRILEIMDNTPQSVENIRERLWQKWECQILMPELMNQLMQLVFMGMIKQIGNSYFFKC